MNLVGQLEHVSRGRLLDFFLGGGREGVRCSIMEFAAYIIVPQTLCVLVLDDFRFERHCLMKL
jgi:hypothetical protein